MVARSVTALPAHKALPWRRAATEARDRIGANDALASLSAAEQTFFESLASQDEPVLRLAGRGVVAAPKPHVRANLAELIADVTEDASVRGVLHHEAWLAIEP